jgi:RodZ C-terminal domain
VSLLVTAKTDTWLEIRSGSSTGPVLYSGTLAAASTKTFRARTLWARFGAAGNLSTRLEGKPIRLPSGTYDATFDNHGFRPAGA